MPASANHQGTAAVSKMAPMNRDDRFTKLASDINNVEGHR